MLIYLTSHIILRVLRELLHERDKISNNLLLVHVTASHVKLRRSNGSKLSQTEGQTLSLSSYETLTSGSWSSRYAR